MTQSDSHPIRNGIIAAVVGGLLFSLLESVSDAAVAVARWCAEQVGSAAGLLVDRYATSGWVLAVLAVLATIELVATRSLGNARDLRRAQPRLRVRHSPRSELALVVDERTDRVALVPVPAMRD